MLEGKFFGGKETVGEGASQSDTGEKELQEEGTAQNKCPKAPSMKPEGKSRYHWLSEGDVREVRRDGMKQGLVGYL